MDNYTGKRLDGRYEIQEVIGVGGMAVVYRAYDNIDDRVVAVKILKDEYLANEEFRRRFKNESKAIAVLSHPNIVKVYDVSYGDRLQYIVMEYVEGITLKEYIEQQSKINWRECIHFMMQILRALQHAHDKGIVHRDVKPQNIMLLQNGSIKVADFGIARFSRSDTRTMTDGAIGSVHYISPEQARGDLTDDKADIYSVGVVLYEMLTGQVPFQSNNSVSVAIMQLQSDPVMPRQINASIPAGLEQITMHAMQKNAKDRYQSAAEMLLDLEEVKRDPTIQFHYSAFVDTTPTRYATKVPAQDVTPFSNTSDDIDSGVPQDAEEVSGDSRNTKTIPILIGITAGLVALIALFTIIWFVTRSGDDIEVVPNFLNMNYDEVKETYKDTFVFDKISVTQTNTANGTIIKQEPTSGTKVKKGDTIKLSVVMNVDSSSTTVTIPSDLAGKAKENVRIILSGLGLKVSFAPVSLTNMAKDTVTDTSPKGGTVVNVGETVTVYYVSDANTFECPNFVDYTLAEAKEIAKDFGITLEVQSPAVNSTKAKDTVVEQDIKEKQLIVAGTKVKVTVSNGIAPDAEVSIQVTLPDKGTQSGTLVVYLDNLEVNRIPSLLCDGNQFEIKVKGSKADSRIKVTVDGSQIYTCKVDFTKSPPVKSEESITPGSTTTEPPKFHSVPNVAGKTLESALADLNANGFYNVTTETSVVSDPLKDNIVQSQDPAGSVLPRSTATLIKLVVGEYQPPANTDPVTDPADNGAGQ